MAMSDNRRLTYEQKIILFAFVCLIIGLPQEIRKLMILNFGFGDIRPLKLYFQIIPMLYIIYQNYRSNYRLKLRTPHLVLFLLLIGGFFIMEKFLSLEDLPHDYQLIWRQLNIYIFFLMLVNFGYNRKIFYKVIDYAFYSGIILCIVYWVGYLGLIKVQYADVAFYEILTEKRVATFTNPNQISYLCAFSFLLLIIKQLNEKKMGFINLFRDLLCISIFTGMIIINASRGPIIISTILVTYYAFSLWRYFFIKKSRNIILPAIFFFGFIVPITVFLAYLVLNPLFGEYIRELFIYKRSYVGSDILVRSLSGRNLQIENAWNNFINHPFTGVGYYSAAKNYFLMTGTRSNNQYLQILASSGVIFFAIYLYYNFRLVNFQFSLLKRPEVALCVIYHATYLLFKRPLDIIAIMGYIAFYFYYDSKHINNNNKRHQVTVSRGSR